MIAKLRKFFLVLLVLFILLIPCDSSYAMSQEVVMKPGRGSSYWVLGDLYTFKAVGEDTGNAYALVEIVVQPQNATPPHIHSREDEAFYIQEGELEFQLGEQTIVATAGTFVHSPKGQLHRYANIGSKPAKTLCWVMPAGFEKFFAEVGVPVTEPLTTPPAISPAVIEKVMATAPKYGLEIIPPPSVL
jgi:quercetin dioxygenase-like cupin family protein